MVSTDLLGVSLERLLETNLLVLQEMKTLRRDVNQLRNEVDGIKQFLNGIQFEISRDLSIQSESVAMTNSHQAHPNSDHQSATMQRVNHSVPITIDSTLYKPPNFHSSLSSHLTGRPPIVLTPTLDTCPVGRSTLARSYTISPNDKHFNFSIVSSNHSQESGVLPSTRSISFTESEQSTQCGSIFETEPPALASFTRNPFPLRKWRHVTSLASAKMENEQRFNIENKSTMMKKYKKMC
ncbi:unnamed protein product, partial [Mesorhabditis belari]|uniref:Uncharacterized protein n=1 Tax=Mesorhabditis belari TaxID=2138241 RepID=A0AAF3F6E7_9BILA